MALSPLGFCCFYHRHMKIHWSNLRKGEYTPTDVNQLQASRWSLSTLYFILTFIQNFRNKCTTCTNNVFAFCLIQHLMHAWMTQQSCLESKMFGLGLWVRKLMLTDILKRLGILFRDETLQKPACMHFRRPFDKS